MAKRQHNAEHFVSVCDVWIHVTTLLLVLFLLCSLPSVFLRFDSSWVWMTWLIHSPAANQLISQEPCSSWPAAGLIVSSAAHKYRLTYSSVVSLIELQVPLVSFWCQNLVASPTDNVLTTDSLYACLLLCCFLVNGIHLLPSPPASTTYLLTSDHHTALYCFIKMPILIDMPSLCCLQGSASSFFGAYIPNFVCGSVLHLPSFFLPYTLELRQIHINADLPL